MRRSILSCIFILMPLAVQAQDGGQTTNGDAGGVADGGNAAGDGGAPVDAGPAVVETCTDNLTGNTVDTVGVCHNGDAVWCSNNEFVRLECGALDSFFEDGSGNAISQAGTCQVFADFGSWCVFPEGDQCYVGSDSPAFGCGEGAAANTMGCDISDGCATGMVACDPDATFTTSCQGDRLVLACSPWGQPVSVNCTATEVGGTTCQDARCVGLPTGSECVVGISECAAGLECRDIDATTSAGTCGEAAPMPDAGPLPADGGATGGDDGGGEGDDGGGAGNGETNGVGNGDTNGGANGGGSDDGCSSNQISRAGIPSGAALVLSAFFLAFFRKRRRN